MAIRITSRTRSARNNQVRERSSAGGRSDRLQTEPHDLDLRTVVHDDLEAGRLGVRRRDLVDDAELHPDGLGADVDRLIDDRPNLRTAAKNIHHVDRLADLSEFSPDIFAMDM